MHTRTKIVATLGPASDDADTIRALVRSGMNVARLNFSHGTHAEHGARLARVRAAARAEGQHVAVLQDIQGPRLRIGAMAEGVELAAGRPFVLDDRPAAGDAAGAGLAFVERVAPQVAPGHRILIDDGRIELSVTRTDEDRIETEVAVGGALASRKGVNLPDSRVDLPPLTEKDHRDVRFGLAHGVDYVALSFVGSAAHVERLRRFVEDEGGQVPVIAKIERGTALDAIEEIVSVSAGVMVARGDLALEIGAAKVPVAQKAIIAAANAAGVPVITATQMLESMIRQPKPTRAETSDVANAVLDGSDALMLSGETAIGRHPVAAVREMASIARETEQTLLRYGRRSTAARPAQDGVTHAISRAAVEIGREVGVSALIAATTSDLTARMVARHRPEMPLIGATHRDDTCRRLALVWGVTPIVVAPYATTDEMVRVVVEAAEDLGLVAHGEPVVITSGQPIGVSGTTNMVQLRHAGDWR